MLPVSDMQKIGIGLTSFGVAFLFLGIVLLFDRGLLAIGNLLFICGLAFVTGLERTFRFFFQRRKAKASICFFVGILLVLIGWPFCGMCLELYGMFLLFSGFLPVIISFIRRIPIIGSIFNLPFLSRLIDYASQGATSDSADTSF